MNGSLYDDVIDIINKWDPDDERFIDEHNYRDDLINFLKEELNKEQPMAIGPQERIKVRSETGKHLVDIEVDERIGIELKKDLKLSEVDRLDGQLKRFKKQYKDLIVVVVGKHSPDNYEELLDIVDKIKNESPLSMGQGINIEVIDKSYEETYEEVDEEGNEEETDEDTTEDDDEQEYNPVTGEPIQKGYTRDHLGRIVKK